MNPKYHLLVAAAALSLSACSTDDTDTITEPEPENGRYKISFTIAEDSETRTTLGKDDEGRDILRWVKTDHVGIYTVGENNNLNTSTDADLDQNPVKFNGYLDNSVSQGDKFYAYYPYYAEQSLDPARARLTIPAEQTQTVVGEYNGQSHPLVAVPNSLLQEVDCDYFGISDVKFRPLGAIVELQIFSSDEMLHSETIRSVTFESDSALAGDFTFNLKTVTETGDLPITGYESKTVTTTLAESAAIPATKEAAARVYLTIAPGTYAGKFVVETDFARYTFSLANAMNFKRAMIKGLPADLATAKCEVIDLDAAIRFKDLEVKRICVRNRNWNTNGDGDLSYREAAAVTEIGTQFSNNTTISNFNELRYFTGLKTIGAQAFVGCINMTSVKIPNDVTAIGYAAFWFCTGLASIKIPNEVTAIGDGAFWFCTGLTSIKIPDGVTTIGMLAFGKCTSLTSITIPQTVTSLTGAFAGCTSLSAFYGKYATDNNRCLIKDGTLLAFAPEGQTEYTIPDGVTTIGAGAFAFCRNLESIKIPNEVTSIGDSAFEDCSSLASINIPDQVTAIGESAFLSCSSLASIIIPDKVTVIEKYTFMSCSNLTEIKIPEKVTTIGDSAFNNCRNLKSVYCKPTVPPVLNTNVFSKTHSEMKIYVPTASVDAYMRAKNWNEYVFKIFADNN